MSAIQTVHDPRWRRRPEDRPHQLIDAALDVFSEYGYSAAKLDDIAHRAGVSKGTIYLYFASKEELFKALWPDVAVTDNALTQAVSELRQALGDVDLVAAREEVGRLGVAGSPARLREDFPDREKILFAEERIVKPDQRGERRQNENRDRADCRGFIHGSTFGLGHRAERVISMGDRRPCANSSTYFVQAAAVVILPALSQANPAQ